MLSKLLKDKRLKDKITLKKMTELVGFKMTYLSDIENHKRIPKNGSTLVKLSWGYNIPFEDVLNAITEEIRAEATLFEGSKIEN